MEVWQREHIRVNLPNLIKTTICSEMFLSHLYAAKVISSEEVDILKHTRNGQEKTGKFYDIIQTRSQSYSLLKTALRETNQTGAYEILHNYKTQYKIFGAISYCRAMLIGRGSYGTMVYRGRFDNRDVAVKVINADYMDLRRAHKEVQFMRDLGSHGNIVKYHVTEETEDFVLIALELCDTNLHDWVTKSKSVMDHDIISILRQVTTGVEYLHSRKIVHRDLKPANILLLGSDGEELQVKISDFGVSKKVPDVNSVYMAHTSGVGTEGWRSPEVIRSLLQESSDNAVIRVSYSSDVFSLGCIFHFVLTRPHGIHPFGDAVHRQVNILNGKLELTADKITIKGVETSQLMKLIRKMTSHAYSDRPVASVVLSHLPDLGSNLLTCVVPVHREKLSETKISNKPRNISIGTHETDRALFSILQNEIKGNVASSHGRRETFGGKASKQLQIHNEPGPTYAVSTLVKKFNVKFDDSDKEPLSHLQSHPKGPQGSKPISRSAESNNRDGATCVSVITDEATEFARCLYSYDAVNDDELSFNEGDIITIISKTEGELKGTGWWTGKIQGNVGLFPNNYIRGIPTHEGKSLPEDIGKTYHPRARRVLQSILQEPDNLETNKLPLVELLNWGVGNDTDLHLAAEQQNMELIHELVKKGDHLNARNDLQFTPLHSAVVGRDFEVSLKIIKYLIDEGADAFAKDYDEQTFLHILVPGLDSNQFHKITIYLLQKGLSGLFNIPDATLSTPFHYSARYVATKNETLHILYEHGVKINAVDTLGNSVLFEYIAQREFRAEFALDLIRFGGNWKHCNNEKQNLLHHSAIFGTMDAFRFALDLGLYIDALDTNGDTPLHKVLKSRTVNVVEMIRLLISKGANIKMFDGQGNSPYALAYYKFRGTKWKSVVWLLV